MRLEYITNLEILTASQATGFCYTALLANRSRLLGSIHYLYISLIFR